MRSRAFLGVAFILALCLGVCGLAFAYPSPALDISDVQNGALQQLKVTSEIGVGSGWVHSIWNSTQYDYNVYWKQPELHMVQGANTFDVVAVCIDPAHLINTGTTYNNYSVSDYAGSVATIEDQTAWNKLTYMWSQVTVTSNADRTALQLATWKGAAGDWNTARSGYWTSADGVGVSFWLNSNPAVAAIAANYLAYGNSYSGGEVAGFKIISDDRNQNFATAVPEPGTILAACSILGPIGFVFRRRRV